MNPMTTLELEVALGLFDLASQPHRAARRRVTFVAISPGRAASAARRSARHGDGARKFIDTDNSV